MIPQTEFHDIIKAVSHCAGRNDHRQNLNGVYFEFFEAYFNIVATDGHRVAVATVAVPSAMEAAYLIGLDDIKEVLSIFKRGQDKTIDLALLEKSIKLSNGKIKYRMESLDLDYPDYKQVLPSDNLKGSGVVRVNSRYLSDAATNCKGLMDESSAIDITARGELDIITLRPELHKDLKALASLTVHVMPMRRT